jgi:hypothetical protein
MSASPNPVRAEGSRGEIHLECLIGRRIHDSDGRNVGVIEEIEAELQDGEWVVTKVLTGPMGMLTRLSSLGIGAWLLGFLGARKSAGGHEIAWRDLDLHDPIRPRLRCPADELDHPSETSQGVARQKREH